MKQPTTIYFYKGKLSDRYRIKKSFYSESADLPDSIGATIHVVRQAIAKLSISFNKIDLINGNPDLVYPEEGRIDIEKFKLISENLFKN